VVVALFRSLAGESLEDYAIRLAQAWRIGRRGLDNGVIFLIFLDDRRMRLEVGYGLEPRLTDAIAASIIRDVVAPRFREGRLADGIEAGLAAIQQAIAGAYRRPAPPPGPAVDPRALAILLVLAVIVLIGLASAWRGARRGRRGGWTAGRDGWVVGAPGWGAGGWPAPGPSEPGDGPPDFRGGGGRFGGGGASGGW